MSKILKNVTENNIFIQDTGATINANSSFTIDPTQYLYWAASNQIITEVGNGNVVVNDGSNDLSISEGIDLLKGLFPSKVSIIPSLVSYISPKLRYDDMNASNGGVARATLITEQDWVTIYEYSGSGNLYKFLINIETKDKWVVRFIVDGNYIFGENGISTTECISDAIYDVDNDVGVDGDFSVLMGKHDKFFWHTPLEMPLTFTTNVKLQLKRASGESSKRFRAGMIILTKEG